jgi:hypothetical protein
MIRACAPLAFAVLQFLTKLSDRWTLCVSAGLALDILARAEFDPPDSAHPEHVRRFDIPYLLGASAETRLEGAIVGFDLRFSGGLVGNDESENETYNNSIILPVTFTM